MKLYGIINNHVQVKNPGILPSKESRKAGDVGQRRAEMEEMLNGAWKACTMAGDGVTYPITAEHPAHYHEPFVADALISNPPTYASLHIAEKVSLPIVLVDDSNEHVLIVL